MKQWLIAAVAAGTLIGLHDCPAFGAQLSTGEIAGHVRYLDERIEEVANVAFAQSEAFRELIDVLESSDVVVYVEQGRCVRGAIRSCLRMMTSAGGIRYLRVTLDLRRSLAAEVSQLAHELRHATEIAGRPEVVNEKTLRALYAEIGFLGCERIFGECWETQAAIDSARLVQHQATAGITMMQATR